jgi:hypothetical protein
MRYTLIAALLGLAACNGQELDEVGGRLDVQADEVSAQAAELASLRERVEELESLLSQLPASTYVPGEVVLRHDCEGGETVLLGPLDSLREASRMHARRRDWSSTEWVPVELKFKRDLSVSLSCTGNGTILNVIYL